MGDTSVASGVASSTNRVARLANSVSIIFGFSLTEYFYAATGRPRGTCHSVELEFERHQLAAALTI